MINTEKLYEIRQHLFTRNRGEINPSLERISTAVEKIENPQIAYNVVHVAGTNGKGSTASMIAAGLNALGEKVGLFTSPHILHFGERFRINGKRVSDDKWLDVYNDLKNLCDEHHLTFFEISALIAFELFRREKCSWVVLETGMGGRFDATNVCRPKISVITSIGIDHTDYLGDTIEKITNEKLGIVKSGVPLLISGTNCENVINLARERCLQNQSDFTISNLSRIKDFADYKLAMSGDFQKENFILALTAMEILGFGKNEKVIESIAKTSVAARMQKLKIGEKNIIFDVAHNPQAIQKLTESITKENFKKPASLIFGMMSDKDTKETIKFAARIAENIFCFTPATKRAQPADYLACDFRKLGVKNVFVCKSAKEAFEKAVFLGETIFVCGSFYVVSEIMAAADIGVL